MQTPDFSASAPRLTLRDPLAEFLGVAQDGIVEYTYADAVKLAGHSCPTVAGAYLLAARALAALYPGAIAERGALSLITGAAGDGGFKGIGGRTRALRAALAGPGARDPCPGSGRIRAGRSRANLRLSRKTPLGVPA